MDFYKDQTGTDTVREVVDKLLKYRLDRQWMRYVDDLGRDIEVEVHIIRVDRPTRRIP